MRVFYVFDDNVITIEEFREVAIELGVVGNLRTCLDEESSVAVVRDFASSHEEPIFVVDLNMNERDSGIRILETIRKKDRLKKSPVIVITSSQEQETINECYELGANAFYRKSPVPDQFRKDVKTLMEFWSAASVHDHCKEDAG